MAGSHLLPLRCAGRLRCYPSRDYALFGSGHVQNFVGLEGASAGVPCWRSGNQWPRCALSSDINATSNAAARFFGRGRDLPCRAHTTASEAWSGSSDRNSDDRGFIWRTTERRFIDFCLSPDDEKRLIRLHEKIVASPWSSIAENEVAECLLPDARQEEELQQLSLFQKLRSVASYLLSPRGLEEEGRRLLCTAIPLFEDVNLTKQCAAPDMCADFERDMSSSERSQRELLALHCSACTKHFGGGGTTCGEYFCLVCLQGAETLKIKLWDAFWDFLTNNLLREGASCAERLF